jgi:hypothetical protein
LKIGLRTNATSVSSFGLGNILFQSLTLNPIKAAFEHLIIDFADQQYAYQANFGEYNDKTHAAYYGRQNSPLTARQHSVGCPTLSQALRLAAVRTREEIGGVNFTEWRNARDASWKTTILALDTEAGQVVSMTNLKIPGIRGKCSVTGAVATWLSGDTFSQDMVGQVIVIEGQQLTVLSVNMALTQITLSGSPGDFSGTSFQIITMNFRIRKWMLMQDYSIQIVARTVTPSMYDLTQGTVPTFPAPPNIPTAVRAPQNASFPLTTSATLPITSTPIHVDTSGTGGNVNLTIIAGSLTPNQTYTITKTSCDANPITIHATGTDTINGLSTFEFSGSGQTVTLTNSGASSPGTWTATLTGGGWVDDVIVANAITPDLSKGLVHRVQLLHSTAIVINNPIFSGGCLPAGTVWKLIIVQDATAPSPSPTFGTNYIGVTGIEIGSISSSTNTFEFVITPEGKSLRTLAPDINII